MHKKIVAAISALALFLVMSAVFAYVQTPKGLVVENWKVEGKSALKSVTLPFSTLLKEPAVLHFTGTFPFHDKDTFVLPRINGYAFNVSINGQLIGQVGDFAQPTSNIWNYCHFFSIRGLKLQRENSLDLYIYGLHDAGIVVEPFFSNFNDISFFVDLQNFLTNGFALIMVGALLMLAVLLCFLACKSASNKALYTRFFIASFAYLIYNIEFIFRYGAMSMDGFLLLRKILMISVYVSCYFLVTGTLMYVGKREKSKILLACFLLTITVFIAAPSYYWLKISVDIANIFLLCVISYTLWLSFKAKQHIMYFPIAFLSFTIIQTLCVAVFKFNQIYMLNYGIFVFIVVFCLMIILEYSNLEKQVKQLDRMARYDPLTGILNRSVLYKCNFSHNDILMFIDINHFKEINDSYGHDKGDEILKTVANTLSYQKRESDISLRYGGDEFIVVFQNTTTDVAKKRAEMIYRQLLKHPDKISISYGVTQILTDVDDAIVHADSLMYIMKKRLKEGGE